MKRRLNVISCSGSKGQNSYNSTSLCYRKSPLYDNCFLHAPDDQPLCTCDKKKAKWYLDKGIGGTLDNSDLRPLQHADSKLPHTAARLHETPAGSLSIFNVVT